MDNIKKHLTLIVTTISIIITFFIYQHGLSGPLLFDDQLNLQPIIERQHVDSLNDVIALSFSNKSGPLGRPVSQGSFALQKYLGQFNLADLKGLNLLKHLLISVLIFQIFSRLLMQIGADNKRATLVAALTTVIWMLHPLHVSTVLYTVQRMTQLSTLFSLLAILIFLKFNKPLQQNSDLKSFIFPSLAIGLCIVLAVYSKENGILIFPILWMLSVFLSRDVSLSSGYRLWRGGLFILPCLFAILAFANFVWHADYQFKGFTLGERLLSQGPVIGSYIAQILLPDTSFMSLHHDDFPLSSGIVSPVSTLFYWLLIVGLVVCIVSSKIPAAIRLGLAWFFIWHLIESTALPLHLYFEHRNYVASIGLILIIAYLLSELLIRRPKMQPVVITVSIVYCAFLVISTLQLTKLWSDKETLYAHWLGNHPNSIATLVTYTQLLAGKYGPDSAVNVMQTRLSSDAYASNITAHYYYWLYLCLANKATSELDNKLVSITKDPAHYDHALIAALENILVNVQQGYCKPDLSNNFHLAFQNIAQYAPQNVNNNWLASVYKYHAYLSLKSNQAEQALLQFINAYEVKPYIDFLVPIIDLSIGLGYKEQAQNYLEVLTTRPGLTESQKQTTLLLKSKLSEI